MSLSDSEQEESLERFLTILLAMVQLEIRKTKLP